ncbi:sodium channel modifier 1-like [Homalodisca vitripennis]|uniref:sodium channel modifier 1-like n=1 Tax=Homalodisca vitripennis TaxID=197043 RepID=UPI001EEC12CB|nr:sodium channel modifier 1-like [Homalodisca vitripennis]
MSFKRDGDDTNLLQNLNHQRVKELLSNHIPQDEAKLLSNGRLACMICLHRPVFDTINMLSMHRRGKRHLYELSKHIQCQERSVIKGLWKIHPLAKMSGDKTDLTSVTELGQAARSVRPHRFRRKPILEILPPARDASLKEADPKSASVTVRHYLKSMSRKSSLDQVVEKSRENYGEGLQTSQPQPQHCVAAEPEQSVEKPVVPSSKPSQDYEVKLRMSGWIKDSLGNWIKDPNVEFDSDEEEAPPPLT